MMSAAVGSRAARPLVTGERDLQPPGQLGPGLPRTPAGPGAAVMPEQSSLSFCPGAHPRGGSSTGQGRPRETTRQGAGKGGAWARVTCGGHGALLDASHVARQELVAEVRKGHIQKHLHRRAEACDPPGGPGSCTQPCLCSPTSLTHSTARGQESRVSAAWSLRGARGSGSPGRRPGGALRARSRLPRGEPMGPCHSRVWGRLKK